MTGSSTSFAEQRRGGGSKATAPQIQAVNEKCEALEKTLEL